MPELFGTRLSRIELMRRIGRLEQVAGVRLVTLGDGLGRGVRVLEFRTGSGFAFDVLVDRCFDVGRCEFRGQPLSWQSAAGVVAPWYYEPDEWGWFRAWGGGMVVTCGLDHTLVPGKDTAADFHQTHVMETVSYGLHGRVGGLPARLSGYGERWDGDECVLWAEGEVLQSAVFGESLVLRRRIEARVGESSFAIRDEVENVGHSRTTHMFLYHCNAGFPVLDAGSELLVPSTSTRTDYGVGVEGYARMTAPVPNATEACFEHELAAEPAGTVPVALVNRTLGLGVYQVFRIDQLPHHTVWRMLGEGTYACGLEPSTNRDAGRFDARERGELQWLEPGETRQYDLEIGALGGLDAISGFAARVSRLTGGHGEPAAAANQSRTEGDLAMTTLTLPARVTLREFDEMFEAVKNWGRWGDDDELGTLNFLTPDMVRAAAGLVRSGRHVTMAIPMNTIAGPDNPSPVIHHVVQGHDIEISNTLTFATDFLGLAFHGDCHTHMDALCHIAYKGCVYNGRPAQQVMTSRGATALDVTTYSDGLVGRGVLLDVPRFRGVRWLEPGEPVTRAELEAVEQAQGVRLGEGDIFVFRTGHHRRRRELGAWDNGYPQAGQGKAGLHIDTIGWMHERRIAAFLPDGDGETVPSNVEGILYPIHPLQVTAMGMFVSDSLQLEDLAQACAEEGRFEFMVVGLPLRLPGATGSPWNPIAIF